MSFSQNSNFTKQSRQYINYNIANHTYIMHTKNPTTYLIKSSFFMKHNNANHVCKKRTEKVFCQLILPLQNIQFLLKFPHRFQKFGRNIFSLLTTNGNHRYKMKKKKPPKKSLEFFISHSNGWHLFVHKYPSIFLLMITPPQLGPYYINFVICCQRYNTLHHNL